MANSNREYLLQQLAWVEQRMTALDKINGKLTKMQELAILARDHVLPPAELQRINDNLNRLRDEVARLEEESRVFWMDQH